MLLIQDNPKGRALTTPKNWHGQNTRWCLGLLICCRRQNVDYQRSEPRRREATGRQ